MKKTQFELTYTYYQYNSGSGDNGSYHKTIILDDEVKALALYDKFCQSIAKTLDSDESRDLEDYYIPYSGFFKDAKLVKVIRDEIVLGVDAKLNDSPQYTNTSFDNCEHCYSQDEGYSVGCTHCDNTGLRQLTPESMQLAESAKEWAEEQVVSLWRIYNAIFKCNLGLTKWSFYGKSIHINAGFSCRGSYTGYDFELPLDWLYAKNREELIQAAYNKQELEKMAETKASEQRQLLALKEQALALEKKLGHS